MATRNDEAFSEISTKILIHETREKELCKLLQRYVKNKAYDLEQRWNIFQKSKFGNHENNFVEFESITNQFEYKYDFYFLLGYVFGNSVQIFDIVKELEEEHSELVDNFKEEVLQRFIKSFKLDF